MDNYKTYLLEKIYHSNNNSKNRNKFEEVINDCIQKDLLISKIAKVIFASRVDNLLLFVWKKKKFKLLIHFIQNHFQLLYGFHIILEK